MIARYFGGGNAKHYNTEYTEFRGVDFSVPPEQVDNHHSPDALNIMVDENGDLTKRPGWRVLRHYPGKITAIHKYEHDGVVEIVVHAENGSWEGALWSNLKTEPIYDPDMVDYPAKDEEFYPTKYIGKEGSSSVVYNGKLWILTGTNYLVYDGNTVQRVIDIAHIPTVSIACSPATGGGTTLEPVNLLSPYRYIQYIGDGETTIYRVPEGFTAIEEVIVNGTKNTQWTAKASEGTVTFSSAPSKPEVTGQDNVIIKYRKNTSGYYQAICHCRIMGLYGLGGEDSDRIFFTGNPEHPNTDWHCEIASPSYAVDPTYIPDTSFARLGSDDSPIMGYARMGTYQVILKKQSAQEATAYLRSYGIDEKGEAYFSVRQGASGIGCASSRTIASLGDEPLFLSAYDGVCAITNSYVTQVTSIQNRSWMVDAKLRKESLAGAFAVTWKNKYLLFCGANTYVLDSRQNKTHKERSGSSFVYESYFWSGINATCAVEINGELYMGLNYGFLGKLSTDLDDEAKYRDIYDFYEGEEKAITAYWTTPLDDDNYPARKKSIDINGLSAQTNGKVGSLNIYCRTESTREPWKLLNEAKPKKAFSFWSVNFKSMDFAAAEPLDSVFYYGKVKNYHRVQFKAENAVMGQNLCIDGIFKTYTYGAQQK